jgi:hypothetical protein
VINHRRQKEGGEKEGRKERKGRGGAMVQKGE